MVPPPVLQSWLIVGTVRRGPGLTQLHQLYDSAQLWGRLSNL